jgi:hypothetical protein
LLVALPHLDPRLAEGDIGADIEENRDSYDR